MKTAIYIEEGVVQLVLTPESDFERNAIKSFSSKPTETLIREGTFYKCQGGWNRHSDSTDDSSLIMRITHDKP